MRALCLFLTAGIVLALAPHHVRGKTADAAHVRVSYDGIDANQADAIAETLSAAREAYVRNFGFDMPETIVCSVACGPGEPVRLYNDGNDRLFLSLPSKDKLAKPSVSGVSNLYGLCHELGHVAMYRLLADRDWLSGAGGAEGWAHFAGSVVVDEVYQAKGERLWPDPYDYRADGSARLARQRKEGKPDDVVRGAGQWQDLEAIIRRKGFAGLFQEWQAAKLDPAKPDGLLDVLLRLHPQKKDALAAWWKAARPVLVESRQGSAFARAELPPDRLSGRPVLLKDDDGTPDGKRSIAGGGHARAFAAPAAGEWYMRSVSVFGARYGAPKAPATEFDVVLCDKDLRPIATWKKPYAAFPRGEPAWVKLDVPPTRVPKDFVVCLVFRPTATSGVFVSTDSGTSGHSFTSVPGKEAVALEKGDWMIRAEIDQPKAADALKDN